MQQLGELLVESGKLSRFQLAVALADHVSTRVELAACLLELGHVELGDLLDVVGADSSRLTAVLIEFDITTPLEMMIAAERCEVGHDAADRHLAYSLLDAGVVSVTQLLEVVSVLADRVDGSAAHRRSWRAGGSSALM